MNALQTSRVPLALSDCCMRLTFSGNCPFNRLLGTAHARGFVQEFPRQKAAVDRGSESKQGKEKLRSAPGELRLSQPPSTNPSRGRVFVWERVQQGGSAQRQPRCRAFILAPGYRGSIIRLRPCVYIGTFAHGGSYPKDLRGRAAERVPGLHRLWFCSQSGWVGLEVRSQGL